MASIITIEIATAIHAALTTAAASVSDDVRVYARGVKTDNAGVIDDSVTRLERTCPMIDIIPTERVPLHHASVLRAYPVRIRVITNGPADPWSVDLLTIGHAVGGWICSAPALSLSLAEFDALVCNQAPETGNAGPDDVLQYMEWQITINTRTV